MNDGFCNVMRRMQNKRDVSRCRVFDLWREHWLRQSGQAVTYNAVNLGVQIEPCNGCRDTKQKINHVVPKLGDAIAAWLDPLARAMFGITSWHPVDGKWSVVVTTCPLTKRKTNEVIGHRDTLPYTLRSLEEAGWTKDQITIYAEPFSHVPEDYRCVWRNKRMKLLPNLTDGIRRSIEADNPDAILIVEDDMVFAPNLLAWLREHPWPASAHMINLFRMQGLHRTRSSPWTNADDLLETQEVEFYRKVKHGERPWGSGALVLLRPVAEHYMKHPWPDGGTPDLILAEWLHSVGGNYWICKPSRAQHLVPSQECPWPPSTWESGANRLFTANDYPFPMPAYVLDRMEQEREKVRLGLVEPFFVDDTKISAVIPAWNLSDVTIKCIRHLAASTVRPRVVYVDNGSSEQHLVAVTSELIKSGLEHSVITNPKNLGFTAAVNQGITASAGDHVLILSNDCFVSPGCIEEMRNAFAPARLMRVGVVNPIQKKNRKANFVQAPMVPFWCTLLHAEAISRVGLLDCDFADGLAADDDWCIRARRAGWAVGRMRSAHAEHVGKSTFRALKMKIDNRTAWKKLRAKYGKHPARLRTTIFLISFNRLSWLAAMAKECERFLGADIHVVDNASTWAPLREWLDGCPYTVHRLGSNLGKKAVWAAGLDRNATEDYVVSDPDLDIATVPDNCLDVLRYGLHAFSDHHSCGLSLRIDDIPAEQSDTVMARERRFWKRKLNPDFYVAEIDTTFSMYRRGDKPTYGTKPCLRAAPPYMARHLPWYLTRENMTDEDRYYYEHGTTWGNSAYAHKIKRLLA